MDFWTSDANFFCIDHVYSKAPSIRVAEVPGQGVGVVWKKDSMVRRFNTIAEAKQFVEAIGELRC